MFLRKPHVEIFEKVLTENDLNPEETLFIDDSPQHLTGARQAGMQTLLMTRHPKDLEEVLTEHHIL
ncbi:D-glucose-1-phosphatase [compost metagenome]